MSYRRGRDEALLRVGLLLRRADRQATVYVASRHRHDTHASTITAPPSSVSQVINILLRTSKYM